MLRFDPTGAFHSEYGVTAEQLQELSPVLLDLRSKLIAKAAAGTPVSSNRFYHLPSEQLESYKQLREASDLGRIFKVANSQMDLLDAVVIVADGGSELGPMSLILSNCDPFHNELRRGPRGGKPRAYFSGRDLDNDTLQSLLSRMRAGGYSDNDVEDRWGIVAIGQDTCSDQWSIAFQFLSSELKANLTNADPSLLGRFLVPVLSPKCDQRQKLMALGCQEIFEIPCDLFGPYCVLSVAGMLPAAMLGLDIMKLLEGAVAMNEHFEANPPKSNMVMQFVAINHLLGKAQGLPIRELQVWDKSLETVAGWYGRLVSETFANHFAGWSEPVKVSMLGAQKGWPLPGGEKGRFVTNLSVHQCRTDPLDLSGVEFATEATQALETAEQYLPERLVSKITQSNRSHRANHQPSIDIVLPTLDTFVLGQLFQMLMIATKIECGLYELETMGSSVDVRPR